jgi:hypothetical protein
LLELNPVDAKLMSTRLAFVALNKAFKPREDELHQEILVMGAPGVLGQSEWDHLAFQVRGVFASGEIRQESEGDLAFITITTPQDAVLSVRSGLFGQKGGVFQNASRKHLFSTPFALFNQKGGVYPQRASSALEAFRESRDRSNLDMYSPAVRSITEECYAFGRWPPRQTPPGARERHARLQRARLPPYSPAVIIAG